MDFLKKHVVMLSQMYYPLLLYIEEAMKAYIGTFYKEDQLRFLPGDLQRKGTSLCAAYPTRS